MKFLPSYSLSVETASGALGEIGGLIPSFALPANVVIELPFTMEFEIRRATLSSSQTATFRISGLGERTRDLLQKDWFNLDDIRAIQFRAGYQGEPSTLLFNGTVKQAQSHRRPGGVDFITEIECFDGGSMMANGVSLRSVAAGTQFSDLIKSLAKDLPGLAKSAFIGDIAKTTKRGSVYAGNTWNYIFQLSGGLATIDNGQLKVLAQTEVAGTEVPVITSASGLLGTPQRYLNMMRVSMLLEPRFTIGQLVSLDSQSLPKFNGAYKVMGINHRGLISASRDGARTTELTLWNGLGNSETWTTVQESPI